MTDRITLETLLQDNTTRAITAQTLRDFIASVPLNTESSEWGSAATKDTTDLLKNESPIFTTMPTGVGIPIYNTLASDASTTSDTLVNTGLSASLDAGFYELDVLLLVAKNNVLDSDVGCGYAVTGFDAIKAAIYGTSTIINIDSSIVDSNDQSIAFLKEITTEQTGSVNIHGTIKLNSAGTVHIQHTKIASGTSIVYANSYLKITPIQMPVAPALTVTKSSELDPAVNGNYYENGNYNGEISYANLTETYWIWYAGAYWVLSSAKNSFETMFWDRPTKLGVYDPNGSADGTVTIAVVAPPAGS
ncbi:MAG: hypothetical protein M0R80_29680, partial [Proteobacteria bacterium]|nr:hypothetical protein [Pseudomonadota bacterium]